VRVAGPEPLLFGTIARRRWVTCGRSKRWSSRQGTFRPDQGSPLSPAILVFALPTHPILREISITDLNSLRGREKNSLFGALPESAYRSDSPSVRRGPCRVICIDVETSRSGMPADCGRCRRPGLGISRNIPSSISSNRFSVGLRWIMIAAENVFLRFAAMPAQAGPGVRIRFPPAASQQRTVRGPELPMLRFQPKETRIHKWDQEFESAFLQQPVCLSGEPRGWKRKAPQFGGILRMAGDLRTDAQAANRGSFAFSL